MTKELSKPICEWRYDRSEASMKDQRSFDGQANGAHIWIKEEPFETCTWTEIAYTEHSVTWETECGEQLELDLSDDPFDDSHSTFCPWCDRIRVFRNETESLS